MAFQKLKKLTIIAADLLKPADLMRVINNLQDNVATALNPLVAKFQNDSTILPNVSLVSGQVNTINHTLGRQLAGWKIVRQRGPASISDVQDSNKQSNLTLLLVTSANVVVDLEVF